MPSGEDETVGERTITLDLAPPNSVILVMDREAGQPPETMGDGLAVATRSCVAIGTLCEVDGTTSVAFTSGPEASHKRAGMKQAFDGLIATPSREVHLCTTALESVAKLPVSATMARVRVWANHESEPDHVLILITAAGEPSRARQR